MHATSPRLQALPILLSALRPQLLIRHGCLASPTPRNLVTSRSCMAAATAGCLVAERWLCAGSPQTVVCLSRPYLRRNPCRDCGYCDPRHSTPDQDSRPVPRAPRCRRRERTTASVPPPNRSRPPACTRAAREHIAAPSRQRFVHAATLHAHHDHRSTGCHRCSSPPPTPLSCANARRERPTAPVLNWQTPHIHSAMPPCTGGLSGRVLEPG